MPKVKLNFRGLSIRAKIAKTRQVMDSITGNPNFPNPHPALADVTALVNAVESKASEVDATQAAQRDGGRGRQLPPTEAPDRGRQFSTAGSPDGRLQARYRDRNLWVSAADGTDEHAVTTDTFGPL